MTHVMEMKTTTASIDVCNWEPPPPPLVPHSRIYLAVHLKLEISGNFNFNLVMIVLEKKCDKSTYEFEN